jgi:hypothetical protein
MRPLALLLRKRASPPHFAPYIGLELGMTNMIISRAPQNVSAWLTELNLMGLPPKDPHDDDDENEQDEEEEDDDEDEDDEPAIIREPDE